MVVTTVKGFDGFGKAMIKRTESFAKNMSTVELVGNRDVATAVVVAVSANLGGKTIRMSGVGKNGANVGVTARPNGREMVVKMTGPAHLIERDTEPHSIMGRHVGKLGKGKGSRSAEAKRKAKQQLYDALFGGTNGGRLRIGPGAGDWRMGPFKHPGTKGKHPFRRGVETVRPKAPAIYDRGVKRAIRSSFK